MLTFGIEPSDYPVTIATFYQLLYIFYYIS